MDAQTHLLATFISQGLLIVAAGYLLTQAVIYIAHKKNLYDHPNHRSSHTRPTPKLGGISFVLLINWVLIQALDKNIFNNQALAALAIFPSLLAIVGFLDDMRQLSSRLRLFIQLMCTLGLLACAHLLVVDTWQSFALYAVVIVGVLWYINLFNFMDGIDGIAGVEAISVLGGLALILQLNGYTQQAYLTGQVAIAIVGFLILNWSPAKIFMGDVGSTFLGIFIVSFSLLIQKENGVSVWCAIILSGVFIVDASTTLATRILSKQQWYAPHRTHAYQKIASLKKSHGYVSYRVMLINLFWLLPFAITANFYTDYASLICVVAFAPLLLICVRCRAGHTELKEQPIL